jgi:hypothetical protein
MKTRTVLCNVNGALSLRISGELGSGDFIAHTVNHYCDFFRVSFHRYSEGPNFMLFKFNKPYVEGYVLEACTSIAKNLDSELELED